MHDNQPVHSRAQFWPSDCYNILLFDFCHITSVITVESHSGALLKAAVAHSVIISSITVAVVAHFWR